MNHKKKTDELQPQADMPAKYVPLYQQHALKHDEASGKIKMWLTLAQEMFDRDNDPDPQAA